MGDLRVKGNLTVDGTHTTFNTTTLSVEDNIIELNRNISNNAGMPNFTGLKSEQGRNLIGNRAGPVLGVGRDLRR